MTDNLVVYRDPTYTTSWIRPDASDLLIQTLAKYNFKMVDAIGLHDWMLTKSKERVNSLAVFGQDVIPDVLMDPPDSNALIRQYLDVGGRHSLDG